ncbi:MAG: MbnP family protein [Bacteroidota bacterium]
MKNLFISTIVLLALSLSNCKKDTVKAPEPEPEAPAPAGNLNIDFEAMVGDSDLVFNTETYTNQTGNTFNVTMYRYYISNIKITKTDNSVWAEPNSYHLIDHSSSVSTFVTIPNVPFGNYKAIEFMIGVDSIHNLTPGTGALDPANGMVWVWNQGYIMAKFEGTTSGQNIKHHIGGWNAAVAPNVLKIVSPSFNGDTAKVTSSISPTIHISSDLLEWFDSPTQIDFATFPKVIMSAGADSKTIADNYADMFSVEHIHNN